MAVTYVTLYLAGQQVQVVEGSQLHLIYASMGATASPPVAGPAKRPDPFPQYVHDDEVAGLVAGAAVVATDPTVAALVSDDDSQTTVALRAAFGAVAGTEDAPHVQLGPTTRTVNSGPLGTFTGVVGLQNNDPAGDGTTRLYVLPASKNPPPGFTYGETSAIKIFGDPYLDGAGYRDLGIIFAPAWKQNAPHDTGTHGTGAFWINSKVGPDAATAPAYWGKVPDIGFSFQDGTFIGGRFAYVAAADGQSAWASLVVGPDKPDIAKKTSVVKLEVQGDIGFSGAGRSLRWYSGDGVTADNVLTMNAESVVVEIGSAARFQIDGQGVTMPEGRNIAVGTATGTKIGTDATQKLGFYGAAPVARPARPTDLAGVIAALAALGLTA